MTAVRNRARAAAGTASWSVTSARVTGTSHRKTGLPCQDDAMWRVLPESGSLVLVVSDGAGSGRLSQFASAIAVRSCCWALQRWLAADRPLTIESLRTAAVQATSDVVNLYQRFRVTKNPAVQLGDFACTLVLVVLCRGRLLMLQVGDGAVVIHSPQGLTCLSQVPDREFANETTFLVTRGALEQPFTLEMDAARISGIAVMSDGVQNVGLEYPTNVPFCGLFQPLFRYATDCRDSPQQERNATLARFLDGDAVNQSTDDDKTLILAVRSDRVAAKGPTGRGEESR